MKRLMYSVVMIAALMCVGCSKSQQTDEQNLNGYAYVDLGLSVKWATCNVLAQQPEQVGGYFAFGDTVVKDVYNWSTYKYCYGSDSTINKYCYNTDIVSGDSILKLQIEDDAAAHVMGEGWRTPTLAEMQELIDSCSWEWTELNGVQGYKVTSNVEGYKENNIFLPAIGGRFDNGNYSAGTIGYFWTSTVDETDPSHAYYLEISAEEQDCSHGIRCDGRAVRAVCK